MTKPKKKFVSKYIKEILPLYKNNVTNPLCLFLLRPLYAQDDGLKTKQAAALKPSTTATRNRRQQEPSVQPIPPPPPVRLGGWGQAVKPAAKIARREAAAVKEKEEIAEGNNDAQQDQKTDRQQLMKDLAEN